MTEMRRPSGIRPTRWAWTSLAGAVLFVWLVLAIAGLSQRYAQGREGPVRGGSAVWAIGLGWLFAVLPSALALLMTWRVRTGPSGEGLRAAASARFGGLAILVLAGGLLAAWIGVPSAARPRLTLETATCLLGGVLLGCSMWLRHVPRPWWPSDDGGPIG
jgi:hypothetical protein